MTRNAELDRLEQRFSTLAAIGGEADGGVTRLAYTGVERDAHALFATWVEDAGGRVEQDPVGNSIGVLSEGEPYLLLGSHLDSVRHGGRWDGTVGVVAGLEAGVRLAPEGPVRVIAFAGEEGARFGRPCLGSSIATGIISADDAAALVDSDGVTLAAAAGELGLQPAEDAWIRDTAVLAFLEVHIEQGRVLEDSGVLLGIVDAVAGSTRLLLTFHGLAEHSGTTPMDLRHDALAAAAEVVLEVEAIARASRNLRATVGQLVVAPGGITTIPGTVTLKVDMRDTDSDRQRDAAAELGRRALAITRRRGVELELAESSFVGAVLLSAWARQGLQEAAEQRGISYRIMPSGAGHDAALVARVAPAALLFIPCAGGRSHVPDEDCSLDDVLVAVDVLCDAGTRLFTDRRRALGDAGPKPSDER